MLARCHRFLLNSTYVSIILAAACDVYVSLRTFFFFFFNDTATTEIYTLSLHDALPISNVFEMAATETITSIILIKLIRVSLGTVRHPRRFKIVVIDIQITLKQMLRDFIGIRVNRAKKSGMVNITSSVNSRERSG